MNKPHLEMIDNILTLQNEGQTIHSAFTDLKFQHRLKRIEHEFLLKKAFQTAKKPSILDLTAGLGRDALILAHLGCSVVLLEQDEQLYTLLSQGYEYCRGKDPSLVKNIIKIVHCNSFDYLLRANQTFDTLYYDPMFCKQKSAKSHKGMAAIQKLLSHTIPITPLPLEKSLLFCKRLVVKRSKNAPFLLPRKENYSIKGKSTRYDIYLGKYHDS